MLWISTGDGDVNANLAQDRTSLLGKLLRIDPHPSGSLPYGIPADNPYAGCGCSFRPEIWAYGLRNPWRWSFDRGTGDIIIGDVGKSDFDEIDYVPAGRPGGMNFGWPITEGDMLLSTRERVTPVTAPPNYLGPITVRRQLDGDTALVGGFVVRDPNLAPLAGRYVYADYFNGQLRSARLSGGGTIDDKEIAGLDAHQDQDAFGQDQCGRLYVIQIAGPVNRLTATGPSTMGQESQGVDCVPLPTTSPSEEPNWLPTEADGAVRRPPTAPSGSVATPTARATAPTSRPTAPAAAPTRRPPLTWVTRCGSASSPPTRTGIAPRR
jgi:hypothetical protein